MNSTVAYLNRVEPSVMFLDDPSGSIFCQIEFIVREDMVSPIFC